MDHKEVGEYWNQNADIWTKLSRMGYDVYRDYVNTPAFLEMLPKTNSLHGLDIGCGEGHNTRLVAKMGSKMTGVDISSKFIKYAKQAENEKPLGIDYQIASATALPFSVESFDFAVAFMSFMDIPETRKVIEEAFRVIKPGGFLQFSISHPCFATSRWKWACDQTGKRVALECGDYFREENGNIEEFTFSVTPQELKKKFPKFKVPRFTHTLAYWLNLLIETGFVLEYFIEPTADAKTVEKCPAVNDTQIIAYFFIIRCRKPAD